MRELLADINGRSGLVQALRRARNGENASTSRPKSSLPLVEAFVVGVDIAAEMLITAGDNTDRVRSKAAFAKLCGTCPIPAGS